MTELEGREIDRKGDRKMILKFQVASGHWVLLDGFKAIEYFHVIPRGSKIGYGDGSTPSASEQVFGTDNGLTGELFEPTRMYLSPEADRVNSYRGFACVKQDDLVEKYLIDSDYIFILNDLGKTVERI